ncbi:12770_t:CDS:2 [Cetraspora pellucida]|uniref:12770_t:CDS:1 n=1 Tax=Cetraspora pellucida TaxID=1433469 RepID=A0A9N8WB04_9GLOM|nr:12770_t:CDS:2 [Cetraspora pellucida]
MERSMSLYEEPLLDRDFNTSPCELADENVVAETSFLNSLDRLMVDTLRMLCEAEGLPSVGNKKEMAERLAVKTVSKLKGKDLAIRNQLGQASERANYVDDRSGAEVRRKEASSNMEQVESIYDEGSDKRFHEPSRNGFMNQGKDDRLGEERRYLMLERSSEKSLQATLAKALGEMKQSLYVIGNKVEEDKFWPEIKMNRPRDQYEYDEWRRIGKELDEALLTKSLEPVVRARELAYTWVYTLRVANKEGWDIAAALRDSVNEDPMEAALREKLIVARQSAKSKKRKTDYVAAPFHKFPGEASSVSLYQSLMLQQQQLFSQWPQQVPSNQVPYQENRYKVSSSLNSKEEVETAGRIQSLACAFLSAQVKCLKFYGLIDAQNQDFWNCDEVITLTVQAKEDINASLTGWCGTYLSYKAARSWSCSCVAAEIAQLESLAVLRALQSFCDSTGLSSQLGMQSDYNYNFACLRNSSVVASVPFSSQNSLESFTSI